MFVNVAKRILVAGVTAVLIIAGSPARSQAEPLVLPGWDLFQTLSGTQFQGIPLQGVPLGSHDFGGTIGVRNTFLTDTIIRRLSSVSAPSGVTGLVMEALQLRSVAPVDTMGNFLFIRLQSASGGPASTGSMMINFGPEGSPHGTFSSSLTVNFEARLGSFDGPLFLPPGTQNFVATGSWDHFPEPGQVQIRDVNTFLNGSNRLNDFFTGEIAEAAPDASHIVAPAVTPEPASLLLLGSGVIGVIAGARKRRTTK